MQMYETYTEQSMLELVVGTRSWYLEITCIQLLGHVHNMHTAVTRTNCQLLVDSCCTKRIIYD